MAPVVNTGVWWHALAFVTHKRAKMSHKPGRNVTQAGPKCHTRAKMSHSHVIIRYFTEAKAEVKYRASARIRGPKHDTGFEWPVSILIMTRHQFIPFKTHKTSAKNSRLLTITDAIWFCRYRQCTPSQLWMHAPVAKERRLMTSQYPIFDRTDNLNP